MTDGISGLKGVLGSLVLGGYDESLFTPNSKSFNFANDNIRNLVVGIQSITTTAQNGPKTAVSLLSKSILSLIDGGVSHIWLPLESCQAFEEEFGLIFDPNTELYLVNDTLHSSLLARNASITFSLSNDMDNVDTINITLPYASFDLELTPDYPGIKNTTRYFPIRRTANDSQNTLGRTFLQEAYLIADYERSTFSVSPCIFSEGQQSNIQAIYPVPAHSTSPTTPPSPGQSTLTTSAITGIAVGTMIAGLCLLAGVLLGIRISRKRRMSGQGELDIPAELHDSDVDNKQLEVTELCESSAVTPELPDPEAPQRELEEDTKARQELQGSTAHYELEAPLF